MAMLLYEGDADLRVAAAGQGAKTLAQLKNCRVRVIGNQRPVRVMRGGHVGRSRGPVEVEASWESAIPKAGEELNWFELVTADADIEIRYREGGKVWIVDGYLTEAESSRSVDSEANKSITFMGGKPRSLPA